MDHSIISFNFFLGFSYSSVYSERESSSQLKRVEKNIR